MLAAVLFRMRPKRFACLGMTGMKMDGVKFVVAHDRMRFSAFGQVAYGAEHLCVVRPTVDEVPQKDDLLIRVCAFPTSSSFLPAEMCKQIAQLVSMAVNVGDDQVLNNWLS